MCSPLGERIAVRVSYGFRRPNTAQTVTLAPLWATALQLCGTPAEDVDLYVQRSPQPNAYAAGGRSVAVTTRILREYRAHRLSEDQLMAVLVHELGHHATGSARFALASVWLAAPWRLATGLTIGSGLAVCGRQSRRLLAVVACAGVVVAVTQAASRREWVVAGLLASVAALSVICPLADAALARRGEFGADKFTADHGLALSLASALRALDGDRYVSSGWTRRAFARHPDPHQRIETLLAPTNVHRRANGFSQMSRC